MNIPEKQNVFKTPGNSGFITIPQEYDHLPKVSFPFEQAKSDVVPNDFIMYKIGATAGSTLNLRLCGTDIELCQWQHQNKFGAQLMLSKRIPLSAVEITLNN